MMKTLGKLLKYSEKSNNYPVSGYYK